jgi:hypothetical protein
LPESDHHADREQYDDPHGDNIAYSARPQIGSFSPIPAQEILPGSPSESGHNLVPQERQRRAAYRQKNRDQSGRKEGDDHPRLRVSGSGQSSPEWSFVIATATRRMALPRIVVQRALLFLGCTGSGYGTGCPHGGQAGHPSGTLHFLPL